VWDVKGLSLSTSYREVVVKLHTFLTWALDGSGEEHSPAALKVWEE